MPVRVEIRAKLVGLASLLAPCGFQGLGSHQAEAASTFTL